MLFCYKTPMLYILKKLLVSSSSLVFFLSTTRHILPLLSQSHFKKCHYSPVKAHNFIIVVSLLLEYLSLEFSFTSLVTEGL